MDDSSLDSCWWLFFESILEAIMCFGRMIADFYPAEETKCADALIECKMRRLHHYEYADFLHFLLTPVSQHFTRIVLHLKVAETIKKNSHLMYIYIYIFFFGILVSDKQEESPQHSIFFAVNALINFPSWRFLIDWQSAARDRHLEDRYSSIALGVALISWWVRVRHWLFYKHYQNTDILISHRQKTSQHLHSERELCQDLWFQRGDRPVSDVLSEITDNSFINIHIFFFLF